MADDPKKKKPRTPAPPPKPVANTEQASSFEDDNALLAQGLQQGGADGQAPAQAPQEHPVQSFWQRINGVMSKQRDPKELARGVARGALNAVTEAGNTIAEGAGFVDRKTGLGEALTPGFNAAYDESKGGIARGAFTQNASGENVTDHYLGKRSDDGLASFTESASQFMTGWMASGELKALKGLIGAKEVISGLARGAAVDASVFDPYEAQLAELAAKAPVPVLKQVGELLSVGEDDGAVVARLKRSVAGLVPAATLEGLIAGTRALRAAKTIVSASATDTEKAAAHAALEEQSAVMQGLQDGSHIPEGTQVVVKPTESGNFTLEKAGEQAPIEGVHGNAPLEFHDQSEALMQAESMNRGLEARATVGQVDQQSSDALVSALENPESIRTLASDPDQLNGLGGSYLNTVDEDTKVVADLSQKIHEALPGIRQGDNTLADTDLKNLAQQMLGYVPENRAYEVVGSLLKGDTQIQSVSKVMAEMVAGAKGRQLAKMSELVDARPHDPVLMGEAVSAVQNYFDFLHHFGMVESDAARMLRLAQQRSDIRGMKVPIGRKLQEVVAPGLAKELRSTQRAAETDALTGLGNRAALDKALPSAEADANTHVLMFDANNFGKVNKIVGDAAGDQSIKDIGAAIKQAAEEHGVGGRVFRKGGDEFVVLAPKDQADAIRHRAETLYGEKLHLNETTGESVSTSLTGTRGNTLQEADSSLQAAKTARKATGEIRPPEIAGMASRDASQAAVDEANVAATLRMIKMAGGDPRNASAVVRATAIQWNKGVGARVFEFFANSLLSGIKTAETISGSGLLISNLEPALRTTAGAITGNRAMMQEGADMLVGNWAYLADNLRSAAAAFKAGRSVIDPIPPRFATGGVTGTLIRTPGRVVGMLDEFLTATNYRAYVRAKSLRLARDQGLTGASLDARVAEDLKAAFDPETGIARIPEALKYAEVPSFKQPLGSGFGKAWQDMANDNLAARFITPFVKAPVNIWRYVLDSTPLLNMVAKRNRDILMAGGEDAALLNTRSAVATMVYGYGMFAAANASLTGRGPSDPELRKMWLKDHQPYSVKVGNQWISYRRIDPVGTPLGLIADTHTFLQELGDKDVDAEHMAAAVVASISQNMIGRAMMSGMAEFMGAFSEGNATKVERYIGGMVANVVPALASSLNPDPYYREVSSVLDAVIARVPGYSQTLPPRYNAFGEKALKVGGVLNRGANMFTAQDATPTIEDSLVELKRALPAFSQKLEGHIDLSDKSFGDGKQLSPYERLMQLVRAPEDGRPSLRKAMEDLVQSPKWQNSSGGAAMFPGGARWILASTLKESYEQRAFKKVLDEYPKLKTQYEAVARMKGAAITSGESGVQQVESMMGVSRSAH